MMVGTTGHYLVWNETSFNCPGCRAVNFKEHWEPSYVPNEFFIIKCQRCKTKVICRWDGTLLYVTLHSLDSKVRYQAARKSMDVIFVPFGQTGETHVKRTPKPFSNRHTKAKAEALKAQPPQQPLPVIVQKPKIKKMIQFKRIDVKKHANRYVDVAVTDKLALIEALKQLIENDRKRLIEDRRAELAQLESGEFPVWVNDTADQPQEEPTIQDTTTVDDTHL